MELIIYGGCRIEFRGKLRSEDVTSERSLIELYKTGNTGYLLRGVDIQNAKKIIFDIPLTENNLYKFGSSANYSDEIRGEDGTYRLWLNDQSRNAFHKELRKILAQPVSPKKNSSNISPEKSQANQSPNISEKNEILVDIHNFSECIQNSRDRDAGDLVKKLVKKGVQLQVEESKILSDDEMFPIKVQIDGLDPDMKDKHKEYNVNVYLSTKVRELRAIFESACKFPSANQYFFVNGHLAYAESTMKDLDVVKNSLFVLFLAEKYPKSYRF